MIRKLVHICISRLQGCQPDVEVWQRILQVRTLVLTPEDDPVMWIKFANLCRKSERMVLAEKTINSLLSQERVRFKTLSLKIETYFVQANRIHDNQAKAPPNVVYAQLKFMWATGAKEESLGFLRHFSTSLARDIAQETSAQSQRSSVSKEKIEELSKLVARCFYKQGEWQCDIKPDWNSVR